MKTIDYLLITDTGTPGGEDVTKDDIVAQHTSPKHLGGLALNRPRIDDLVTLNGELVTIIPESNMTDVDLWGIREGTERLEGQPKIVAYAGGVTKDGKKLWDTRTNEQKDTLAIYVKYHLLRFPNIKVMGLNQVPALKGNETPNFNVSKWLETIGVNSNNYIKTEDK